MRILQRSLSTINTRWKRRRHVIRKIQALQWEVNVLVDLVGEGALEREAFELDKQDRWQAGDGELLGSFAEDFAVWAFPEK